MVRLLIVAVIVLLVVAVAVPVTLGVPKSAHLRHVTILVTMVAILVLLIVTLIMCAPPLLVRPQDRTYLTFFFIVFLTLL